MSENHWKDRLESDKSRQHDEIEDWMAGPGAKVLGVIVVALIVWAVAFQFWN